MHAMPHCRPRAPRFVPHAHTCPPHCCFRSPLPMLPLLGPATPPGALGSTLQGLIQLCQVVRQCERADQSTVQGRVGGVCVCGTGGGTEGGEVRAPGSQVHLGTVPRTLPPPPRTHTRGHTLTPTILHTCRSAPHPASRSTTAPSWCSRSQAATRRSWRTCCASMCPRARCRRAASTSRRPEDRQQQGGEGGGLAALPFACRRGASTSSRLEGCGHYWARDQTRQVGRAFRGDNQSAP